MSSKTNNAFNVLLSDQDVDGLDQLAELEGCSKGLILRKALRAYHAMRVLGVPTCANGQRCPVPHIHAAPQLAATPIPVAHHPAPPAPREQEGRLPLIDQSNLPDDVA